MVCGGEGSRETWKWSSRKMQMAEQTWKDHSDLSRARDAGVKVRRGDCG